MTEQICQTIINEKTGEICGHKKIYHGWKSHFKEKRFGEKYNGANIGKCIIQSCPCKKFTPKTTSPAGRSSHNLEPKNHSPLQKTFEELEEEIKGTQNQEELICEGCNKSARNLNPCEHCGFENLGFINQEKGCGKEIDIIEDNYGEGSIVNCGDYNIRKSTGERVKRLCPECQEKEK